MTCCVAAICDDGKTIVMIADRMIGIGIIQSEPDITKLRKLHNECWVLFSGDDISPVFDVIDIAKDHIRTKQANLENRVPLTLAMEAMQEGYQKKRMQDAEALYLKPIGWDIGTFNATGPAILPDFEDIKRRIEDHFLPIDLIITGFGTEDAYIFALSGFGEHRGIPKRLDIPGFACVGSGGIGASYMLYYREMSYKKPLREALYNAMEAKLFGEQASGVGEKTDVYVATHDGKFITLDEKESIDGVLVKVWNKLRPHWIGEESRKLLNSIPELAGFPELKKDKKKATEGEEKP